MAFGTGTHATTQMASYFVNKLCTKLEAAGKTASLIDVGTGTGILAMLASFHNLGTIKGIEIDPEARRVARENLEKNNLEDIITITDELIENVTETYDIVVANIIDGVLIQIREQLLRVLAPGGHIFLTGILLEREETFLEEFIEPCGLKMLRRIEKDEWVGFWLQA
jgi:ribosomal protein L11 methyltransferase